MKSRKPPKAKPDNWGQPRPHEFIHDVPSAAARCMVCPDTIRAWIEDGLQAMPVATRAKGFKSRKQYRIKECWLMKYVENRAAQESSQREESKKGKGRPTKAQAVNAGDTSYQWDDIGKMVREMKG